LEACELFGIAYKTAKNACYVCRAFESSFRKELLEFGHHLQVANRPDSAELLEVEGSIHFQAEAAGGHADAVASRSFEIPHEGPFIVMMIGLFSLLCFRLSGCSYTFNHVFSCFS